jgi:hypothetical protein
MAKSLTSVQKHALLLNCIGQDAVKIINGITYDKTTDPYEELVKELQKYFIPKANFTYERYRFRKLKQEEHIMSFVNELHCIAKKCDFDNTKIDSIYNQNVRDQFILGLQSDDLRRRLLSENTLTLDKAIQIALAHESSSVKADEIRSSAKNSVSSQDCSTVLSVNPRRYSSQTKSRSPSPRRFSRQVRFSSDVSCRYCKKSGHTIENCFKLQRKNSGSPPHSRYQDDRSGKSVSAIFSVDSFTKGEIKKIDAEFYDCNIVAMIDTGSSISLVSKKTIEKLDLKSGLVPVDYSATVANGQTVTFKHAISGPLVMGDVISETLLYVTDWLPDDCLLGMDVLGKFRSLRLSGNGPDLILAALPSLVQTYSDVFDKPISEACYTGKTNPIINLEDNAKPYQAKQRKLSLHDEGVCKEQIENLLAQGVIAKSASPWRHVPVVVPKRSSWRSSTSHRLPSC